MAAIEINPLVRHYTVEELAEKWNVHPETVRSWFRDEPGVLKIVKQQGPGRTKRKYATYRIPEPVMERVYRRMVNP